MVKRIIVAGLAMGMIFGSAGITQEPVGEPVKKEKTVEIKKQVTPEPIRPVKIKEEQHDSKKGITRIEKADTGYAMPDAEDVCGAGEDASESGEVADISPELEYLGDWTISFYCPCPACCGEWAGGPTASGVMPSEWWTAATDGLEFGTIVQVDGLGEFEIQDRGTEYGWLDVYVGDHQEALNGGLQTRAVYIVRR